MSSVNHAILTPAMLIASAACSTDEHRPNIQGMKVFNDNTAIAVDGHILLKVKPERPNEKTDLPDEGVVIHREVLKHILSITKNDTAVITDVKNMTIDVGTKNIPMTVSRQDDNFPNTNTVWPEGAGAYEITFNIDRLHRLFSILKKMTMPGGQVTFSFHGNSATEFSVSGVKSGDEVSGLIMPNIR